MAPVFTSAELSAALGMSTHAQGNSTHTHVYTQAHALPSRARDAPDHQGCKREALH